MTTNNHPAHGPVSLDRLHQISEILSKAAAQSDGGNLGYAMADAVKVIDGAIARELVRREHAIWSQTTFGDVGPVGPLKHLSKEALEAAAEPGDLSEWADMQFLLWDAQRRAGISDEQITQAMVEKLAVNKQREWPKPKDGEPRLHIKAQPAPVVPTFDEWLQIRGNKPLGWVKDAMRESYDACRDAMLEAGNSPVTPDGSEDTKRLDWLDAQNKRLNEYYGTSYGWKFDANFQRNAMMLNDSNYPVMNVRQAIDEAIAAAPQHEVKP
ncbi:MULTISPECIES: DUF550 domain-containing protein [Citrobacter]|nr:MULTISPECIES: DUF550 domain-containing protein [Citrobacter]